MKYFIVLLFFIFCQAGMARSLNNPFTRMDKYYGGLLTKVKKLQQIRINKAPEDIIISEYFKDKVKVEVIARGNVSSPVISGDGKTIAWNQYFKDEQMTHVMRYADGKTERISSPHYSAMWPSLSEDSKVIVWTATPRGHDADWDIERWEDGMTRVMAGTKYNEFFHEVSGDGQTIVFDRDETGNFMIADIYVIRNGSIGYPEPIATVPGKDEAFPIVSHDGSLLFWREFKRVGNYAVQDVYRFEKGKRVPTLVNDITKFQPVINDDASIMPFVYGIIDDGGIYIMKNLDPDNIKPLADNPETLQWSPAVNSEGSVIAWTDALDTVGGFDVWIHRKGIDAQLTVNHNRLFALPTLSSDGNSLVFVDFKGNNDYIIYRVDFLD